MNERPSNARSDVPAPVIHQIQAEVARAVIGMHAVTEQILITVLCRSHSLLEGFAGAGKWLVIQAVARALTLESRKLRASPDLSLAEIVPVEAQHAGGEIAGDVKQLPIFANFLYVDGIDRLSPKAYSMLQQAMQERVTGQARWGLAEPFVLFGARQPDETPPAEVRVHDDRYLFKMTVGYPPYDEEFAAAHSAVETSLDHVRPVVSADEVVRLQSSVHKIQVSPSVVHYAVRLVRATRVHEGENLDFVYEWVQRGAGPRATTGLVMAARARAVLHGRTAASHQDIQAIAAPVLRHRIITNQNAVENGITVDRVVQRLLEDIPAEIEGDEAPPRPGEAYHFHNWTPR